MPQRPASPCSTPGCPHLTRTPGRCPTCKKQADKQRGTAHQRGYNQTWQRIRLRYLTAHPYCETPGCTHPATDVHHLDNAGPRGNNHDTNLQALCHQHHSSITSATNRREGR